MKNGLIAVVVGCVLLLPIRSLAQQADPATNTVPVVEQPASVAPSASPVPVVEEPATNTMVAPNASPAPVVEEPPSDGVRFRWGVAAVGGGEFVSDFAFGMGGVEARLGVQINHLVGIYAQPYLAFGAGSVGGGATGFTGTAGASALVDFTIADRFFVGAGGGFGVLNNPTGPEIHFRVGGYPVMGFGSNGIRRRGLMVGLDTRVFFLDDVNGILPVVQIMAGVGYEAF